MHWRKETRICEVAALGAILVGLAGCSASEAPGGGEHVGTSRQNVVLAPIHPAADTRIASAVPFGNDGTGNNLGVTSATVVQLERSLIRFNQAAIEAAVGGEALYSARLDLHVRNSPVGWLGAKMDLLPMTVPWPEGTGLAFGGHGPTWVCRNDTNTSAPFGVLVNNCPPGDAWGMLSTDPAPQPFSTPAAARASIFTGGGLSTISWNVTREIQRFLDGDPNNGWILVGAGGPLSGTIVNFSSRETSNPPELILEVGPDLCLDDPSKGAPGECGCGVPDLDTNFDGVADCFDAAVPATADTTLRLAVPFGNDGTGTFLGTTSASIASLERTLVKVDQAAIDAARQGRKVKAAYLDLTVAGVGFNWGGAQLEVLPMVRDWEEGTGLAPGGHGATWVCANDPDTSSPFGFLTNNCSAGDAWAMEPWQPEPLPFNPTPTDAKPLFWPGMTSLRFDVTADVQRYIDGDPNHGWIIKGTQDLLSGEIVYFGSRESGAPPMLLMELEEDLVPTLNCVTQLDSTRYGAVFGYRNETGGALTLGAGPQNEMSLDGPDRGQPILFVPGDVPVATFQAFPATEELTWTLRGGMAVASASSPPCAPALTDALLQLYGENPDAAVLVEGVVDILQDPRFSTLMSALREEEAGHLNPFESSLMDAMDIIVANADLLGDPSNFTQDQLNRLSGFREALLANSAVVALRLEGDAARIAPGALACDVVADINQSQSGRQLIEIQPGSLQAKFAGLAAGSTLANVQQIVGEVATGSGSAALLTLPGLALAGMKPIGQLLDLELSGPIPTLDRFTKFAEKAVKVTVGVIGGATAGAAIGLALGGPKGAVIGGIIGGIAGGVAAYAGVSLGPCEPCSGDPPPPVQCSESEAQMCVDGCCKKAATVTILSAFYRGDACPGAKLSCNTDADCGSLGRCVATCCEDQFFDLCPGSGCTADSECSAGETCQWGCCAGRCGLGGNECDEVEAPMCSAPKTCPSSGSSCVNGCCSLPQIH
jgi:hypothetical protein